MAYDIARFALEATAVGISITGFTDGEPVWTPALEGANVTLANALKAAHVAADGVCGASGYLNTDLESDVNALALKALVTAEQWAEYVGIQISQIKALRATAMQASGGAWQCLLEVFRAASTPAEANLTTYQASCAQVCSTYPFATDPALVGIEGELG